MAVGAVVFPAVHSVQLIGIDTDASASTAQVAVDDDARSCTSNGPGVDQQAQARSRQPRPWVMFPSVSMLAAMDRTAIHEVIDLIHLQLGRIDELRLTLPLDGAQDVSELADLLGSPPDLVTRMIGKQTCVCFFETIIDKRRVEQALVRPLTLSARPDALVFAGSLSPIRTYSEAVAALLGGHAVVLRPLAQGSLAVSMDKWPQRNPTEPPAEIVPQGPHTGFVENLDVNVALIRHRIRDRRLRWERFDVGERSHGPGGLFYVQGLVREDLLADVRRRLSQSRPSFMTDASMLQEWLTSRSGVLFPTMDSTERPDTTVAALLEGRVAVLVDGSPVALLAPSVLAHFLQTPEDYYNRSFDAPLKRSLRLLALLLSLIASPLFVAVVTVGVRIG